MNDALLDQVAWVGQEWVRGPIRGIVIKFGGLGDGTFKPDPDPMDNEWGNQGILPVKPYHNPWAWMNPATQAFADEVIDGVIARNGLSADFPVVSFGGSMGGHAALTYALYSKHNIVGVAANCPVCDLVAHYSERPDLPRTMHSAFGSYGPIESTLELYSPVHQAAKMPDISYFIVHGGVDQAVNKQLHSDKLVAALRDRGVSVEYVERPNMRHCNPIDYALYRQIVEFVAGQF